MNALDFFRAKNEAYISPMGLVSMQNKDADGLIVIDVRIGPKPNRIPGAIAIPQLEIEKRLNELPKDKLLVLYCWETWCSLASKAAVPLLEYGFKVQELFGGIAAWESLGLPVESTADAGSIKCDC